MKREKQENTIAQNLCGKIVPNRLGSRPLLGFEESRLTATPLRAAEVSGPASGLVPGQEVRAVGSTQPSTVYRDPDGSRDPRAERPDLTLYREPHRPRILALDPVSSPGTPAAGHRRTVFPGRGKRDPGSNSEVFRLQARAQIRQAAMTARQPGRARGRRSNSTAYGRRARRLSEQLNGCP